MGHEFFVNYRTGTSVGILLRTAEYDNGLEEELTSLGNGTTFACRC